MRVKSIVLISAMVLATVAQSSSYVSATTGTITKNYKEDVDKNGLFDVLDLSSVASKYNFVSNTEGFDSNLDVNSDNCIDIFDLTMISKRLDNNNYKMKEFEFLNNPKLNEYKNTFKIANDNIQSVASLGGNYGSNSLANATDGDINTFFETGKSNSDTFKNEVTFTFKEVIEINKINYASRQSSSYKGFMKSYEIYGSLSESGDDFTLILSGSGDVKGNFQEIKFPNTKFKRLKMKFIDANAGWASIGEVEFYKEDVVFESSKGIFKDGTWSTLNDNFNTLEKISAFEEKITNHPFKDELTEKVTIAKDIINNPDKYKNAPIVTASQRGHENKEAALRQVWAFHSLDSFGYYVAPGETFTVYVDADEDGIMPTLLLGQAGKDINDWRRWYTLKPGKNTITAQTFDKMMPAAIYIVNRALPHEQKYAPRVRLEGGTKFPMYVHGKTTPEEFRAELEAYAPNVSTDINDFANGKPEDGKVYNLAELVSENNTITISALGALKGLKEMDGTGVTVSDTMDTYEKAYHVFQRYGGFVEGHPDPKHTPLPSKFTYRVFSNGPYGWADWGYTGYNGGDVNRREDGFYKSFVKPLGVNWAEYHEVGHKFNNMTVEHLEVTNNLFSQQLCLELADGNNWVPFDELYGRVSGKEVKLGFWTNLGFLTQVEYYYGKDTIPQTYRVARDNPNGLFTGINSSTQRLVLAMSIAVGYDLLDHFEFYKYVEITDAMREKVAHLPKPTVKLHYVNETLYDYAGNGFVTGVTPKIESVKTVVNGDVANNSLVFSIDKANEEHLLGFEVYRDGELVGFTRHMTYIDENISADTNYIYTIKAVDKKVNIKGESSLNSKTPTIVLDDKITIEKGKAFNPLDYVKAFSANETDLTSSVTVKSNNVNINSLGNYTVVYKLTDTSNNITTEKSLAVDVVSEQVYLSDLDWVTATTEYSSVKKDLSAYGTELKLFNGYNLDTIKKGIGTHARSEIVYDLTNEKYEKFESYIGVDGINGSANRSSVIFEVYVDGQKKYTSKLMTTKSKKEFISVDIKNAKELKLVVTDGGNGIASDGAIWGDSKLVTNNAFPRIIVPNYRTYKLLDTIDLREGISVIDAEDGDITSSIQVSGIVNNNVAGDYIVTYTVKDKNNNTSTKNVTYSVVDMNNFDYVSDIDWKSANCGHGSVKKDLSPSNGTIRLTNSSNQEERFEKGLGTHATTTIIYDLTGTSYKYFTAKVGVDRAMFGSIGSVSFEVYVDGVKKYDTGRINSRDPYKEIEVDINGGKELKIVATDGGNGNGSDHSVWADAKFHKN